MLDKDYTVTKQDLEEFGGWLFAEGFYAALADADKTQTSANDPYGTSRRDKAVRKIFKKLEEKLQRRPVHLGSEDLNVK